MRGSSDETALRCTPLHRLDAFLDAWDWGMHHDHDHDHSRAAAKRNTNDAHTALMPQPVRRDAPLPRSPLTDHHWLIIQRTIGGRGGISRRQAQLIRLMLENLRPQQIARIMKIKVRTVRTHRERLYESLQVNTFAGVTKHLLDAVWRMKEER